MKFTSNRDYGDETTYDFDEEDDFYLDPNYWNSEEFEEDEDELIRQLDEQEEREFE